MQKRTIVIFRLILTCPISRLGAVSTTGHGESIAKVCLAHRVVQAMQARAPKEVSQNVLLKCKVDEEIDLLQRRGARA